MSLIIRGAHLRMALSIFALVLALSAGVALAVSQAPAETAQASKAYPDKVQGGPVLVGHVTWQGAPAQPDSRQQQPITLTLKSGLTEANYPMQTTDPFGFFTVPVGALPNGIYNWRAQGPDGGPPGGGNIRPGFLANSGSVSLSGVPVTQAEMGFMLGGDADNSNAINAVDFNIFKAVYGTSNLDAAFDKRADFTNNNGIDGYDFLVLACNFGASGAPFIRPGEGGGGSVTGAAPGDSSAGVPSMPDKERRTPPHAGSGNAFMYFSPEPGAPPNGGTVNIGDRFVLDLRLNTGVSLTRLQQSYFSFTSSILQNASVPQIGGSCVPTSTVTFDLSTFEHTVQNEVCNGLSPCLIRGMNLAPGSAAVASGSIGNCAAGCSGDFRVARIGFCAAAPGTATLHWEFSPPAPVNRDTAILDNNCTANPMQDPLLFTDYVINVVGGPGTPTLTPQPTNTATSTRTATATSTPTGVPTCGPGSDYVFASATAVLIPGVTDIGNHSDDLVTTITLPFTYNLYGLPFTTVNASSNGNLQFSSANAAFTNACLPSALFNYAILPHWDDLRTDAGTGCAGYPGGLCGIFTEVVGTAPNRVFVIEWRTFYFNTTNPANFEVLLYEGQPRFDFVYGVVTNSGVSATVGVQRSTGVSFTQFSCNIATLASGLQLIFTPTICGALTNTPTNTPTSTPTNTPPASCGPLADYTPILGSNAIVPGNNDTGNHCDDCITLVGLPFPYSLYDQIFNTANISSNGNLQFVSNNANFNNICLPAPTFNYTIFSHWDDLFTDLDPGCGIYPGGQCGVYTSVSGTAPNRVFNIEWRAISFDTRSPVHFEVRLHENQSRFDLLYGQVEHQGGGATVGVQRGPGPQNTQFECNIPGSIVPGMQITFTQPACASSTSTPTNTRTPTNTSTPTNTPQCPNISLEGSITTNDLLLTGRLVDGSPSTCPAPKAFPGLVDMQQRRYDQYRITNTGSVTVCVTVNFNGVCSAQLRSAAYVESFDPEDLSHNYLADSSNAGTSGSYSFNMPAGGSVVVIMYGSDPDSTCTRYVLSINDGCTIALRNTLTQEELLGDGNGAVKTNRCDRCDPVNTATGNFWLTDHDLDLEGRGAPGVPLVFSRSYNSQAATTNGPMGYGWTHSYNVYLDFNGTNTLRPTPSCTAVAVFRGHVTWQGPPAQPDSAQQQPVTLTVKTTTGERNYPNQTTDESGFFTVTISGLANGPYNWRVKGPKSLANTGVFTVTGATVLNVEMGLMRAGDANNDNIVSIVDFNILKNTFGLACNMPGYDSRADFTNDCSVSIADFNLVKQNFNLLGAPPIGPQDDGSPPGKPSRVPTGEAMRIWQSPRSSPEPDLTNTLKVAVREGTGGSVPFTYAGDPLYHHEPEVQAELYLDSNFSPDGSETYIFTRTHGSVQYGFNSLGLLTEISDRNHYTTTLQYNGANLLTGVTEPGGRTLVLTYTCGFLTSVKDQYNRSVYYGYNSNGDLTDVIDAAGNFTHYDYYTTSHRLKAITYPTGGRLTNGYDNAGRVLRQDELVSQGITRTTLFEYILPTMGLVSTSITPSLGITSTTVITDPLGNVAVHEYHDYQLETITENARGTNPSVWEYTYGGGYPVGLAQAINPNGHKWINTWDANGNLLTSADPLNRVTRYAYDAYNDPTVITDALGITTTYTYDGNGNLLNVRRPLTQTNQLRTTSYAYDPARPGDVLTMTDPLGFNYRYTYHPNYGFKLTDSNPLTETTSYSYDNIGRLLSLTNPLSYVTSYAYNAYGDKTIVTDTLGYTTVYTYDGNRNLTTVRDANSHVITYTYDLANRRTRETKHDGTRNDYFYDFNNNLITHTNGLNQSMLYGYDALNRLITTTDPLTRTTTYKYDLAGNRTVLTDALGLATTYTYDLANQARTISYSGAPTLTVSYNYDALGRRTAMTDSTGISLYSYDSLNRLTRQQSGLSRTVGYSYDLNDNLTALGYPDIGGSPTLTVTRGYNAANRLTALADWVVPGISTTFTYDANGNWKGTNYRNGSQAVMNYDAADRLITTTHGITSTVYYSSTYGRDNLGLLTSANQSSIGLENYAYDALDRLTGAFLGGGSPVTRTWGYDAAYQITQTLYQPGVVTPFTTTRSYDAANELTSLLEKQGITTTRLLTFTYDLNGNRGSQLSSVSSPITYIYDKANRLAGFDNGANQYTNQYNGDGLRMRKFSTLGNHNYTWDVSGDLAKLMQDSASSYIYGPNGAPIEAITGGNAYFYHADQLGSVRALSDAGAIRVATYQFDPYGALVSTTGSVPNPLRYAGEYTDAESGLIYLRARHYDPSTQQFLTRDPLVAKSGQPYIYANSSPLNYTDPSGLLAFAIMGGVTIMTMLACANR